MRLAGSMCTGKRQTHIRNAPLSRTAVTGIDPYNWRGYLRVRSEHLPVILCSGLFTAVFNDT